MRQIAQRAHLPGRLVIAFVEDPQARADTFAAEIHHLSMLCGRCRRCGRGTPGSATPAHVARKPALAESYGVTRPTLDK